MHQLLEILANQHGTSEVSGGSAVLVVETCRLLLAHMLQSVQRLYAVLISGKLLKWTILF